MLLPKEPPFLTGLNSYYLDIEKFIQHLQGDIGSGCLYCKAADQELMVYFDEYDIVRGLTQKNNEPALVANQLDHILPPLQEKNFQVTIYYLDADSIFFWGQMPAFRRRQEVLTSDKMRLPDLIFRLSQKKISGFIEIDVDEKEGCAVLFFYEGQRRGGSYYWGTGGLSPSDADYNTLLGMLQKNKGTYHLGYFTTDPLSPVIEEPLPPSNLSKPQQELEPEQKAPQHAQYIQGADTAPNTKEKSPPAEQPLSELNKALNAFIAVFTQTVQSKKGNTDPLIDLKLKFIDFAEIYSFLDPYNHLCAIEDDGTVTIGKTVTEKDAAEGIIDCAWMVIEDNKLHKKFRAALEDLQQRDVFQAQGIKLER
ncbi:hypothetical protein VU04_10190 [Desulfobulbus sp. TB]|nr:hypothetical protein [Desulfobulbus sp. TB]